MSPIKVVASSLLLALSSFLLISCAQNLSPNTYTASEVGVASKAVPGVIISKRAVNIDGNSGAGGVAGLAAGAAAGSAIGGSAASNIVGAVGGAVIGGLLGNSVDKSINHHQGYEYIIKLNKGSTVSVVQADEMQFSLHQHVMVIYGPKTRIIPDDTRG